MDDEDFKGIVSDENEDWIAYKRQKEEENEEKVTEESDISINDIHRQIKSISERLDKYDEIRENASKGMWFGYLLQILMVMVCVVFVMSFFS